MAPLSRPGKRKNGCMGCLQKSVMGNHSSLNRNGPRPSLGSKQFEQTSAMQLGNQNLDRLLTKQLNSLQPQCQKAELRVDNAVREMRTLETQLSERSVECAQARRMGGQVDDVVKQELEITRDGWRRTKGGLDKMDGDAPSAQEERIARVRSKRDHHQIDERIGR